LIDIQSSDVHAADATEAPTARSAVDVGQPRSRGRPDRRQPFHVPSEVLPVRPGKYRQGSADVDDTIVDVAGPPSDPEQAEHPQEWEGDPGPLSVHDLLWLRSKGLGDVKANPCHAGALIRTFTRDPRRRSRCVGDSADVSRRGVPAGGPGPN